MTTLLLNGSAKDELPLVFNLDDIPNKVPIRLVKKTEMVMNPSTIVENLNRFVVGQEEAKKALSIVVSNHLAGLLYKDEAVNIRKSNLLILGSSGSGKTLLIQSLKKFLDLDVLIVDITQFSRTGYVGRQLDEILDDMMKVCDWDEKRAEKGIIFIDEIDKISSNEEEGGSSVSTTAVQNALLKMIEGNGSDHKLNTDNVLFIFGGAFSTFLEKKNDTRPGLGFTGKKKEVKETKFTHEDLIKAGFRREFAGRIGHIVQIKPLTKAQLKQIITEPEDSVMKQMEALAKIRNLNLTLTDRELNDIVEETYKAGIGARGLKVLVEQKLFDRMYV